MKTVYRHAFTRTIAVLLAAAMLLGYLVLPGSAQTAEEPFRIVSAHLSDGKISFYRNEKPVITAAGYPAGAALQWQIAMPDQEGWVDITGQEEDTLTLSYALVANIMDAAGMTSVRCRAISSGAYDFTPPVDIQALPGMAEPEIPVPTEATTAPTAAVMEPTAATTVPTEVVTEPSEETTAPTEAVTEPTEETTVPTEAVTEPTVETTAPTEAVTEPAEETTTPTETVTEPTVETTVPTEAVTEPAEETTAPTEAVTEPAEETTAPTEAVTEPAEETTAPTEAVTEPVEETTVPTEAAAEPIEEPVAAMAAFQPDADATALADAADSEDENIVTVTIAYIYWDRHSNAEGEKVWNSYTARIPKGDSLNVTVDNRSRPAYKTVLASDNPAGATLGTYTTGESAGITYVTLNLTNVQTDLTFKVYYEEIMVPYAARYFLQNINNDLYTENNAYYQEFEGYQGDSPSVAAVKKEIVGFTSLFHQPDTIAADGSTVFEVYYDRTYYLINFDLDGGYGTAPVYARYETLFNVAEPTKPGYVFAGWQLIEQDGAAVTDAAVGDLPSSIPAHNQTYQAQWDTANAQYTVVYWKQTPDGTGYEHWGSKTVDATSGTLVQAADDIPDEITKYKDATENNYEVDERLFFHFNADLSDKNVLVEGDDSTIVNAYYDRNEYTLKFYYAMSRYAQGSEDSNYLYVIGGSTHFFGKYSGWGSTDTNNVDEDNEVALLTYFNTHQTGQRGGVTTLPALNDRGKTISYKIGSDPVFAVTTPGEGTFDFKYHYISFTALYGENIKDKWPCDVFESATRANTTNSNGWPGDKAFVSAWNGEYNVWYSRHKGNPTIKGKYEVLDYRILWQDKNPEPEDGEMIVTYLCFWENGTNISWSIPELWFYRQWVPVLEGETVPSTVQTKSAGGITYKLMDQYPTCDDSDLVSQTQVALEGFSGRSQERLDPSYNTESWRNDWDRLPDTKEVLLDYYRTRWTDVTTDEGILDKLKVDYSSFCVVDFYYNRNIYDLRYHNHGADLDDQAKQIPYQTGLGQSYNITPPYPEGLEPDAYTFQGWYTTPHFASGTEFTFTNETMPASDLTLYAKWAPITHTATFYMDYDQYDADNPDGIVSGILHGTVMHSTYPLKPTHPTHPEYRFVQWFYMQDGKKVAFEPSKMVVNKDLELYAEWTSTLTTQYSIRYMQQGTDRELAAVTNGYAFEATTKTFRAKPAPDLDLLPATEREKLWLPATNSHSILMKNDAAQNTFTFYYEVKDNAPYTIRYVDKDTGKELGSDYVATNSHAIITARFKYFENYIPDDFYKQLILSANDSENVVTFYYTKAEEDEGVYFVGHYIQDLDADGNPCDTYSEYFSETRSGKIGSVVTESAMTISGYTPTKTSATGTITSGKDGETALELKLYYTPIKYGYRVEYLDTTTHQSVADTKTVAANHYFGSTVSENAVTVNGYDLVAGSPATKTLVIGSEEERNVITFYYEKKHVIIHYQPISLSMPAAVCGNVSISQETPKDYTKDIQGCTATPTAGFQFQGWYYDALCTNKVPHATGQTFSPAATYIEDGTKNNIYEFTYYARFEPTTLTITKAGTDIEEADTFLFRVKGTSSAVDVTVSIQGTGSVTLTALPFDTYTVTELTGWSWTYSPEGDSQKRIVMAKADDTLDYTATFTNKPKHTDWLHAESRNENQYQHNVSP